MLFKRSNDPSITQQKKNLTVFFLVSLLSFITNGLLAFQMPLQLSTSTDSLHQSAKYKTGPPIRKTYFGKAAGQLMMAEVFPLISDRYIRNRDYARISFQSFGENLKPSSWTWDKDDFGTNEFAHPYHGSTFFSAFRTNGYTFWQSVPASFAGSYIWETFGENEPPSPNDFINTGFGGFVLGEMTYRLSKMLVNNRSTGFGRQVTEVLALLINPMNGYRRILDRKWGRPGPNTAEHDSSRLSTDIGIGIRNFNPNRSGADFGWYGNFRLIYGNPFENYRKPFSNITINGEFGRDDSSLVNNVNVHGSLAGWELSNNNHKQQLAILSANYDYIRNEAFYYSAQSIKLNLFSIFNLSKKITFNSVLGLGPIILAAVPDHYGYRNRDYAFCSGIGANGNLGLNISDRFSCSVNYRGGLIKTINGNPSHYFLHTFTGELRYRFLKAVAISFEPGYFNLHGHYKYFADVNETYPYLRFSFRYHLNN